MKKLNILALGALLIPWDAFSAEIREISGVGDETPIFITIGQSNADGTAIFNADEDARLKAWYDSESNPELMKMWYRSCYINTSLNNKCWCFDGTVDVEPGWLNLWYRNENTSGRTAMNMHSHYGTWPTDGNLGNGCNRRGMEGQFGMRYQQAYPDKELYVIKLGCGGSAIATWTSDDNHNWDYFYNNMFKPAIDDLLAKGKKPRLAGVWWMQGCKDRNNSREYYLTRLKELIGKIRTDLGFADAKIYIGHIVKPGENPDYPNSSKQFGQSVRDAQDAITSPDNVDYVTGTEIIDGRDCPFEADNLHWNHVGVNRIGDKIADRVIAEGPEGWASFSTPGKWRFDGEGNAEFVPAVGKPKITYATAGDNVTATLKYAAWSEEKTMNVNDIPADDVAFEGDVVYVKAGASGSGVSWDDAMGSLAYAVRTAANNDVRDVCVANGRYILSETLTVPAGVTISGGYAGEGDATVVTVSGSGAVISLESGSADSYAEIKRLTVTDATSGRGVTANSYGRIYDCVIENNMTKGKTRGTDDGAGVWLGECTRLERTVVRNNEANSYAGGGVSIDGSNVVIKNCLVTGNTARLGHGKTQCGVGGILHWASKTGNKVINTTITENKGLHMGGIWFAGSNSSCQWTNCVIWHNTNFDGSVEETSKVKNAVMIFENTFITKAVADGSAEGLTILSTENDADNGPHFTAPEDNDYTLALGSPLIDAGSDTGYGDGLDSDLCLIGNLRKLGESVDVGAYESSPTSGINNVVATPKGSEPEYYDLRGVKVNHNNFRNGIYIERSANGARKVYMNK